MSASSPYVNVFQNIICYYQTQGDLAGVSPCCISKHHMLLPNQYWITGESFLPNFKTSYVITKQVVVCSITVMYKEFQNIICYYQTKSFWHPNMSFFISKHHMLLPNAEQFERLTSTGRFQNIICYYQTAVSTKAPIFCSNISKHHMLLPNSRF